MILLTYILLAVTAGALSCFVVWSRLPNYSDGASHAGVLGFALAAALGFKTAPWICGSILLFAAVVHFLSLTNRQSYDNLVAVVSNGMTALGIAIAIHDHEVEEAFFGSGILSNKAAYALLAYSAITGLRLLFVWKKWVLVMINEDLARVDGTKVKLVRTEIMAMVTLYIMLLMDAFGMIMVASTLAVPASAARYIAKDCATMIAAAIIINVVAVVSGYFISFYWGVPMGSTVVLSAFVIFLTLGVFDMCAKRAQ